MGGGGAGRAATATREDAGCRLTPFKGSIRFQVKGGLRTFPNKSVRGRGRSSAPFPSGSGGVNLTCWVLCDGRCDQSRWVLRRSRLRFIVGDLDLASRWRRIPMASPQSSGPRTRNRRLQPQAPFACAVKTPGSLRVNSRRASWPPQPAGGGKGPVSERGGGGAAAAGQSPGWRALIIIGAHLRPRRTLTAPPPLT